MKRVLSRQFLRFVLVGIANTALGFAVFNLLIIGSGISRGFEISVFSALTFAIVVTHSFFWNKYKVFKSPESAHEEYVRFFVVSTTTALINVGVISFIVNVIGAPSFVSEKLWANFALLCSVPVSMLGNFFGYTLLVFRNLEGPGPNEGSTI